MNDTAPDTPPEHQPSPSAGTLDKTAATDALRGVQGPGAQDGLVAAKAVEWVAACDGVVSIKLHLPGAAGPDDYRTVSESVAKALTRKAKNLGAQLLALTVEFVDSQGEIVFTAKSNSDEKPAEPAEPPAPAQSTGHRPIPGLGQSKAPTPQDNSVGIPGIKHAIAVGAGKGGVGKSSVAVNLAVGLARQGHAVGIMDGDIYGPSLPTMLGLGAMDQQTHEGMLQPHLVHGVKAITLGKMVDPEKPLIWRGPMAHGAFKQLAEQTAWGELDYLIIDLPPGTGDVPLTMAQMLKLTGAVIVCTPQRVAQDDAVRAARMFQQLGVDILGVVENMSYFVGDDAKEYDIFGRGGAETMAQRLNLPFLGALPITMSLRANSDNGDPTSNYEPSDDSGRRLAAGLEKMVANVESQVALASLSNGSSKPTLTIS